MVGPTALEVLKKNGDVASWGLVVSMAVLGDQLDLVNFVVFFNLNNLMIL